MQRVGKDGRQADSQRDRETKTARSVFVTMPMENAGGRPVVLFATISEAEHDVLYIITHGYQQPSTGSSSSPPFVATILMVPLANRLPRVVVLALAGLVIVCL